MHILLVEGDFTAARGISMMLNAACYLVNTAGTGQKALELAQSYDCDVVILGPMLPDMTGYELIRRMRAAGLSTPMLILSGLSQLAANEKELGLDVASFISEPFDKTELITRMQAVVRRSRDHSQPNLQIGELQLNRSSREVLVSGNPVAFTSREYSALELLVKCKGLALTKQQFLDHLYSGIEAPELRIIDVIIYKLCKKLANAGAPNLIGTVWGRGYILQDSNCTSLPTPACNSGDSASMEAVG